MGAWKGLTGRIFEVVITTTECGRVRIRRRTEVDSGDSAGELKSSEGEAEGLGGERGSICGFRMLCSVMSFPEDLRGGAVWNNRWASEWTVRIAIIPNWNCEPRLAAGQPNPDHRQKTSKNALAFVISTLLPCKQLATNCLPFRRIIEFRCREASNTR